MTKKQELLETLKGLYVEIGFGEANAEYEAYAHRKNTIADIEDLIVKAQRVANVNKAQKEKDEYLATEDGAKAVAEAEARLEQLKVEVESALESTRVDVDALIKEKMPLIAPYQVTSVSEYAITLNNPTVGRRLEIEIRMEKDYCQEKEMEVSINVAACGSVDVEKVGDAVHMYYTTIGRLLANNAEVVEVAKYLQSRLKSNDVLYDEERKCKNFLKNPLNSPFISKY